jgi:hypothetical protein
MSGSTMQYQEDTFYVESEEISMAERSREQKRALDKIRQREMAAELSVVTSEDYLEEILDHMEHMEVRITHIQESRLTFSVHYNA